MSALTLLNLSVATVMIAGVGGWVISARGGQVAFPISAQVDPFQAMATARDLPTQHYDDYSLVF